MPIPPALPFPLVAVSRRRLAALCLSAMLPLHAAAQQYTAGTIVIVDPWSRATPSGASAGAGYMVVRNTGAAEDRLVSIASPAADHVTPHSMAMTNGVMQMRASIGGVPVPAHGEVVFRPGADHIMFEGLKRPFAKGESVAATLVFEKAGTVPVEFKVQAVGAKAPEPGHGDMKM